MRSTTQLFTTRCVQRRARGLGAEFKEAAASGRGDRRRPRPSGAGGGRASPSPSPTATPERFLVCTQDETLRRRLRRESPMTPVLFCHTSGLQMEPPAPGIGPEVPAWRLASNGSEGLGSGESASLGQEESARDVARACARTCGPKARGPNPLACNASRERSRARGRVPPAAEGAAASS